jgi:hypothetical protein
MSKCKICGAEVSIARYYCDVCEAISAKNAPSFPNELEQNAEHRRNAVEPMVKELREINAKLQLILNILMEAIYPKE